MGLGGNGSFIGNAKMGPLDILIGNKIRFILNNPVDIKNAFLCNLILGIQEPFFSFRMSQINGPVKRREEYKTCFMHCF
jgi:hypothetical protein